MLSKKNRIKSGVLLTRILRKGRVLKGNYGIFRFESKDEAPSQFAVIVSKKVEPKANKRNKIRRRITEALRTNLKKQKGNLQGIFIANQSIKNATYSEIEKQIIDILTSS